LLLKVFSAGLVGARRPSLDASLVDQPLEFGLMIVLLLPLF